MHAARCCCCCCMERGSARPRLRYNARELFCVQVLVRLHISKLRRIKQARITQPSVR